MVELRAHRLITVCAGVGLLALAPLTAQAIQPVDHLQGHDRLEVADGAPARTARVLDWRRRPPRAMGAAWARMAGELGTDWAAWDRAKGTPARIVGAGVAVPGASVDDAVAERFAEDFVADHLALLAPGAVASDFVLVTDHVDGSHRTIALQQHVRGVEVLGATVSLRFVGDRLVAVANEAVPVVDLVPLGGEASADRVRARAEGWLRADVQGQLDADGLVEGPFVLPIVSELSVRLVPVLRTEVVGRAPASRWIVYADAATGEPVAREQLLRYGEGTILYDIPRRGPAGARENSPATYSEATPTSSDTPQYAGVAGDILFAGLAEEVTFRATGPRVALEDQDGDLASLTTTVEDADTVVWSEADQPLADAQLASYMHTRRVQDYVQAIDPELPWIQEQMRVNVNINDACNAFFDPGTDTINFFQYGTTQGLTCENTGRISDVVYHEYGHAVHNAAIIPGVGVFEGALSEGISDYLAGTINDDPDMGVGFFADDVNSPLRDIDPQGSENVWPDDRGEIHYEGLIIAGTLWDLRKLLVQKYEDAEGVARTDRIWYESIRRAVDIPSMYFESLVANDDDGDLSNGTPDVCEINEAFARHGLYQIPGVAESLQIQQIDGGWAISLEIDDPFPQCSLEVVPQLAYRVRGSQGDPTVVPLDSLGLDFWGGFLPSAGPTDVMQYQVRLVYETGTVRSYPDNIADPWYEAFDGPTEEIWCETFENELQGWNGGGGGSTWEQGAPAGLGGDPETAWQGSRVLGNVLDAPGLYSPGTDTFAETPAIDVSGYDVVRLQYRRWLTVEDGFFDQARIRANGQLMWENFGESIDYEAHTHHTDREWRFHDVVLTDAIDENGEVRVSFELVSDGGLELGGWNLDQLCIVGQNVWECGNGVVEPGEQCDDGNLQSGDGCDSACLDEPEPEPEPEPIDPDPEPGDTGAEWGGAGADDATLAGRGCGCSSLEGGGDGGSAPAATLLGLVGVLGLRRRRRDRQL